MCLGDTPEAVFPAYRATLAELGHTLDGRLRLRGLRDGARGRSPAAHQRRRALARRHAALATGERQPRPHAREREPTSRARGMPHHHAPDKEPARRLAMIAEAGRLRIPFTTGILIGIGETPEERVDALFAIADLQRASRPHSGSDRAELPRQGRHSHGGHARADGRRHGARRRGRAPRARRRHERAGAAQPESRRSPLAPARRASTIGAGSHPSPATT